LLHLVDLNPFDESDPLENIKTIAHELQKYSAEYENLLSDKEKPLAQKEIWLVFNKCDLLSEEEMTAKKEAILQALDWKAPNYVISGMEGTGTKQLCFDILDKIEKEAESLDAET